MSAHGEMCAIQASDDGVEADCSRPNAIDVVSPAHTAPLSPLGAVALPYIQLLLTDSALQCTHPAFA